MSKNIYQFDENAIIEMPTIELAYEILKQAKKTFYFKDLTNEIAEVKKLNEDRLFDYLPQLYTEINIDGRFIHLGQNEWGLKSWYPLEKAEALLIAKDIEEDEDDLDFLDDEDLIEEEEMFDKEKDEDEDDDEDEDELINDDEDIDEETDIEIDEEDIIVGEDVEDVEDEEIEYFADDSEEDIFDDNESEDNL